jgi:ubiquitin-protein ligase
MGEPVSTILGGLGVAGLVSVCLDCFDIVHDGLNLGRDYVLMEGRFSALRIRLFAWSKACGFLGESGPDPRLSNAAWRGHVQKQLNCICFLFMDAAKIVKKYDLVERHALQAARLGSPNAPFIDEGMQDFLRRIKQTKSRAGFLGVFIWALKDRKKFQELIDNLKEFVEALELVAKNLDLFDVQQRFIQYEIESISDINALEIIASSGIEEAGNDTLSDIASQRLLELRSNSNQTHSTYQSHRSRDTSGRSEGETFHSAASCLEQENTLASIEEDQEDLTTPPRTSLEEPILSSRQIGTSNDPTLVYNRQMMQNLFQQHGKPSSQPIHLDDASWGARLQEGEHVWLVKHKYHVVENTGFAGTLGRNSWKRIFKELRSAVSNPYLVVSLFSPGGLPSLGELPVVLLTIEGPPHSPYRDGIFHLWLTYPSVYPFSPLKLRFLTPIYHPNIDDRGEICMDTLSHGWSTNNGMGTVVMSLCSLLSDPDVEDPLVPELAALYVKNRSLYEKNAEEYTKMHATFDQSFPEYGVHVVKA